MCQLILTLLILFMGVSGIDLFLKCDNWKFGPKFLWLSEKNWPFEPPFISVIPTNDPEVKRSTVTGFSSSAQPHFLNGLVSRYSSWSKLMRVCAWVVRFKECFLTSRKTKMIESSTISQRTLSLKEMNDAKLMILSDVQSLAFSEEIESLKQN